MYFENKSAPFFFCPEVEHLSHIERDQLHQEFKRQFLNDEGLMLHVLMPNRWLLSLFGASLVLTLVLAFALGLRGPLSTLVFFVVIVLWAAIFLTFGRRHYRRTLQHFLLGKGIPPARCFRCKYDLRGSDSHECPECGEVLLR